MYADYSFYKNTYGGTKITDTSSYAFYAEKASYFMDFVTRGHLIDNLPSAEYPLSAVKMCCAELADKYREIDEVKTASESVVAGGGTITSMSSGGESISIQPSELQTAVASGDDAIRKYLMQTVRFYLSGAADDDGKFYLYWGIR